MQKMKHIRTGHFEINGTVYHGIDDLWPPNGVKPVVLENYLFDVYQDKFGNFVLRRCELYPCFDSSDRMFENRFYRSYFPCASHEECMNKYEYIVRHHLRCNDESDIPAHLAPFVYADDGLPYLSIIQLK